MKIISFPMPNPKPKKNMPVKSGQNKPKIKPNKDMIVIREKTGSYTMKPARFIPNQRA